MKLKMSRVEAKQAGETRYIGLPCKYGHGNIRATSTYDCVVCRQIRKQADRKARRAAIKAAKPPKVKKVYVLSPEALARRKEYQRNYWNENNVKRREKRFRRRTAEKQRTPQWLTETDKWMMREAYQLAKIRTELFGFKWEVDHILPLRGKTVSGLHVPANLQVIPKTDNRKKGNNIGGI